MRFFEINEGIRMGSRELSNIGLGNFTIGFEFEVELRDGFPYSEDMGEGDGELDIEAAREAHREYWNEHGDFTFMEFFDDSIDIDNFILENNIEPVYGWVTDIDDYVEQLNAEEKNQRDRRIAIMREDMKKYSDEFISEFKDFYENEYLLENDISFEKIKEYVKKFQMNNPRNVNRYPDVDERERVIENTLENDVSAERVKYLFYHDVSYFANLFYLRVDEPKVYSVEDVAEDFENGNYIFDEYGNVMDISDEVRDLEDLLKYFDISENDVRNMLDEEFNEAENERRDDHFDEWLNYNDHRFMVGGDEHSISYVKDRINDLGYDWDVVSDGSLQNGAEIVSEVFDNINEGFRSMRKIFEMIRDDEYMHTSVRTGFHINIGTWRGNEVDNIDWLKFLVVYRAGRLLDEFRRRMNNYSVDRLSEIVSSLEKMNLKPFYDNIGSINSIVLGSSRKNSAINLSKLRENGIIEIRATGNSGYEDRADYIIEEVKKIILALEIAGDREAYRREYAKKLYKLLSSAYNKRVGKSENSGENPVKDFFGRISGGIMADYEYLRAYDMIKFIIRAGSLDSNYIKNADRYYTSKVHKNIIDDLREYSRINGFDVKAGIEELLDMYDESGQKRNSKFISSILKSL